MKRAGLSLSLVAMAAVMCLSFRIERNLGAGPVTEEPAKDALTEPPIIKAAPEKEWTPAKAQAAGAGELKAPSLAPSTQPIQSLRPIAPKEDIKPELRLPLAQPSLIVNPMPGEELKVESPSISVPILELPESSNPPIIVPMNPTSGDIRPNPAAVRKPPLEESAMMGKKFAISAVLGAAMLAAPLPTARADEKDDMKFALERLEKIAKDLKSLEANMSKSIDQNRQVNEELANLKNRIAFMEDDVKFMRSRLDAPSTTSKRESTLPAASSSKLRLVNEFLEEMSIRVNDRSYRLMPGEDLTVSVPAGAFSYQILQLQRFPQERVITPGETKTIRVVVQR